MITFIHSIDDYYNKERRFGIAEIIIGKQCNGPVGTVKLTLSHSTRFDNLAPGSGGRGVLTPDEPVVPWHRLVQGGTGKLRTTLWNSAWLSRRRKDCICYGMRHIPIVTRCSQAHLPGRQRSGSTRRCQYRFERLGRVDVDDGWTCERTGWPGEGQAVQTRSREERVRTILAGNDSPDIGFRPVDQSIPLRHGASTVMHGSRTVTGSLLRHRLRGPASSPRTPWLREAFMALGYEP